MTVATPVPSANYTTLTDTILVARGAGQAAAPAAHQGAQQILVRRVVPPGKGLVGRQLGLHLVEMRLACHGGRLAHEKPNVLWLQDGRAVGTADGARRRAPVGGGAILRARGMHLPRVGRVAQDAPDGGAGPPRPAPGRGHAARVEVHGELHQRSPGLRDTWRTTRPPRRPQPDRSRPLPDRAAGLGSGGSRKAHTSSAAACQRAAWPAGPGACARQSGCAHTRPRRRGFAAASGHAGRRSWAAPGTRRRTRRAPTPPGAPSGGRRCAPGGRGP